MPEPRRRTALALDVGMLLLAVVSLLLLYLMEARDPSPLQARRLLFLDLAIVAIFWVEYLARFLVAPDRRGFVGRNWYELPGMVPILPGMEAWGGVRVFRLLRILRVLRFVGALRRFERVDRLLQRFLHESKLGYVAVLATLLVFACATVVYFVEQRQHFPTFGDALWWAVVTATTVGYGDYFPRTGLGRLAGVVLMILGVTLIGTFAATLGSFLVERRFGGKEGEDPAGLADQLERLSRMREQGALTKPEFDAAKRKLLR